MNFKKIFNKNFRLILLLIILAESLSYAGFWWPVVNSIGFLVVCLGALALSLKNIKYGLLLVFAELFIGSMGRLFFLDLGGLNISIRMALWLIIMSVWLTKILIATFKKETTLASYFKLPYGKYFYTLGAFIILGLLIGYLNHNQINNIFFDFNNWLYLILLFPLSNSFKTKDDWQDLFQVFSLATFWLCTKTLILLYTFSHNLFWANLEIYRWLRISGVAEITEMQSGFYRLFFQSHIFVLLAFCLLLPIIAKAINNKAKTFWVDFVQISVALAVLIIGMSRSFWVGLAVGGLFFIVYLLKQKFSPQFYLKFLSWSFLSLLAGVIIITILVKFPYPTPGRTLWAWDILNERSQLDESAVSSRWNLLPKLWQEISQAPILGKGFGTTVVYQSSDPRFLEQSADGLYETYAFEWAWLDLWLKLGILGVLIYLWFLIKLIRDALSLKQIGVVLCLVALAMVNVFTPYLNHPLGLGALMLIATWLSGQKQIHKA